MATLTLRPNGDNTVAWLRSTGSLSYALIDEASADDADYLETAGGTWMKELYDFPNHSSEEGSINSVKLCARCIRVNVGTGGTTPKIKFNISVSTEGTEQTLTLSWALYTQTWTTNPADSAAWEWADIDALAPGIQGLGGGTDIFKDFANARMSQYYIEVDYTPPGWANIKNIRMGTGSIIATDLSDIWYGTSSVPVADHAEINGVVV
jgi:hypothetical protein